MLQAESDRRVPLTSFTPVQGGTVQVTQNLEETQREFLEELGTRWIRDKTGRSLHVSMCALDYPSLPSFDELTRSPFEIVADAMQVWGRIMVAVDWDLEVDVEFLIPGESSFACFSPPHNPEKATAAAQRKRLLGAIAASMGHVVLPAKYSWQRDRVPPSAARDLLLRESEVWLDCMIDRAGWDETFCETVTPQAVYRDWPRPNSLAPEDMDRLDSIVYCADLGGKEAGVTHYGPNLYCSPARMHIPSWSLDGLREELALALRLPL